MKEMGFQLTIISFLKFLLQEIEKIVLINFRPDPIASAEFSLVSNLGSMIPRYVYSPIEVIISLILLILIAIINFFLLI